MRNYPEYYRELNASVRHLREAIPATMSGYKRLRTAALEQGALSPATKELIALGIAISIRCEACITYHVSGALKAGATRQEIEETTGVAILMGGGPSVMYGAAALEALRQFDTHPKEWAAAGALHDLR